MIVTLSMIVRDAAADLPACLASVRGCVDEVVIADTGSRDGSRALARGLGARVIETVWEDDFARARNAALDAAQGDWVLVLDADERFDSGGGAANSSPEGWRRWLARVREDAFQVRIRNYMPSPRAHIWDRPARPNAWYQSPEAPWPEAARAPAWVEHENVRLFRRRPELRFAGRVHESVGPAVAPAGLRLGQARGCIHHLGMLRGPGATAEKNRFYRALGRRKAAECPQDAQAQFELGVTEFENFHDAPAALLCFERALRLNPRFALAWLYAAMVLLQLGHPGEAAGFLAQARASGSRSPRLPELEGDAACGLGRYGEARQAYRTGSRLQPGNMVLLGKLGLAQVRAGEPEAGLANLRRAVREDPECAAHYDRLVAACVWLGDRQAAAAAQEQKVMGFPGDDAARRRLTALQAGLEAAAEGVEPPSGDISEAVIETAKAGEGHRR